MTIPDLIAQLRAAAENATKGEWRYRLARKHLEDMIRLTADGSGPQWIYRYALSALDAQEAAGEGVTECLIEAGIDVAGDATRDQVIDIIEAVHPAIFAAGERAGLEKAAAKMKHLHGGGEADNPHDAGWQAACVAGERAIRSLKGGTT